MSLEHSPSRGGRRSSFTISEWCDLHDLSRGTYYKLRRVGKAPKCFNIGTAVRITPEADAEWVAAREAETSTTS
jgi:hypothetical protein